MCLHAQKAHTNNSAPGGHRAVQKVANERYYYIVFIFSVFLWTRFVPKKKKKQKQFFLGICLLHTHAWICTKKRKKSKLYNNTFHLPPSGLLWDHLELSYLNAPFACADTFTNKNAKNQNYITKPFICHFLECSVTTQSRVFLVHTFCTYMRCACMCMYVHKKNQNQSYIAIPFICHLQDNSDTTQSSVIGTHLLPARTVCVSTCSGVIYFFPSCLWIY